MGSNIERGKGSSEHSPIRPSLLAPFPGEKLVV